MPTRRRLLTTAHGSRPEAFGPLEWGLVVATGGIWGASFLFIAAGLDAFAPPVITFSRLALGALTLAVAPAARRPVDRRDWPSIVLLGVLWMTIPFLLFPVAQQWVDSAVAGMINGVVPVLAAVVAAVLLRHVPGRRQMVGIGVGFVGVVLISLPSAAGADASPFGVALLLVAVSCYAVASNLTVPLQQRYGALPVVLRAELVAVALTAPVAAAAVPSSRWAWDSALAMVPLGVLGSGLAFFTFITLLGRAGAARGAIAVYLTPVVAIVLGVVVRDETVHALALAGSALVIFGAWLTGREERAPVAGRVEDTVPAAAGR